MAGYRDGFSRLIERGRFDIWAFFFRGNREASNRKENGFREQFKRKKNFGLFHVSIIQRDYRLITRFPNVALIFSFIEKNLNWGALLQFTGDGQEIGGEKKMTPGRDTLS